jgi:hypothetical protein
MLFFWPVVNTVKGLQAIQHNKTPSYSKKQRIISAARPLSLSRHLSMLFFWPVAKTVKGLQANRRPLPLSKHLVLAGVAAAHAQAGVHSTAAS